MIEGSLSDVSLPGLLQFLATESNKSFKVSLVSGGQKGDLLVCEGEILSANYGLLEGNDALTELLFWRDGSFTIDLLKDGDKAAVKGNLKIILRQVNTFADQMSFLRDAAVGLNSEIVPSLNFGTQAWQEALAKQPLFKEDYAVLGWITDGRTMRQAMREFSFDVVRATSSLFRLLSTGSVEILRPTLEAADAGGEVPLSGLAAILDNILPADDSSETFDASPQAGDDKVTETNGEKTEITTKDGDKKAEAAPATTGTQTVGKGEAESKPESDGKPLSDGKLSKDGAAADKDGASSIKGETKKESAAPAQADAPVRAEAKSDGQLQSSFETELEFKLESMLDSMPDAMPDSVPDSMPDLQSASQSASLSNSLETGEAKALSPADAQVVAKLGAQSADASSTPAAAKDQATKGDSRHHSSAEPAPVAASRLVKMDDSEQQSTVGTATGATFNAVGGTMELSTPAPELDMSGSRDVITCDSLPAVGSDEFNEIMAKAQKASEQVPDPDAPPSQAVTAQIHLPTSFRTSSDKLPIVTGALTPEVLPIATAAAMARQTIDMDVPKASASAATPKTMAGGAPATPSIPVKAPVVDSASAWAAAVRVDVSVPAPPSPPAPASPPTAAPATEESPEKRLFDIVRTDPLPIVAIDIERLFQTSFHISPFGHVSLGNDVLDADLKKILLDFKSGKTFINVATESEILPAQVLHYCKYCLERGYIDPPDAVTGLTADLLLGRVELEQYLLQRRRITGDELRDVADVARQKGIKLTDLLVKLGFMTASDWDRLCQEKERFARR